MFRVFATILLLVTLTISSPARSSDILFEEFDARRLTETEKRFLQVGLALAGHYDAMIDGAWGAGSQEAFERYAADFIPEEKVPFWAAAALAIDTFVRFEKEGWTLWYMEPLDLSILIPGEKIVSGKDDQDYFNLEDSSSSLRYSFTLDDDQDLVRTHAYVSRQAANPATTYSLRKSRRWVTSARKSNGVTIYARSEKQGYLWRTVILSASTQDKGRMAAVAGSIRPGRPADLDPPENGLIALIVEELAEMLKEDEKGPKRKGRAAREDGKQQAAAPGSGAPGSDDADTPASSGTAFLVTSEGDLLTNHHVVDGCASLTINGEPVSVVNEDEDYDLALLSAPWMKGLTPLPFSPRPAALNADVTVAGFPLAGLLSGLNITRGTVTSMKGLRGNSNHVQISAPVQPGNSGGPAVDMRGEAIGVVVAKLDAQIVANVTGDIPQNINFAVRGTIARLFLQLNGVEPVIGDGEIALPPEEIAERLSRTTFQVNCN